MISILDFTSSQYESLALGKLRNQLPTKSPEQFYPKTTVFKKVHIWQISSAMADLEDLSWADVEISV